MCEGLIFWGFLESSGDSKPEKKESTAAKSQSKLKKNGLPTYWLQRDPAIQPTANLHHERRPNRKSEVRGVFGPLESERESTSKLRPR